MVADPTAPDPNGAGGAARTGGGVVVDDVAELEELFTRTFVAVDVALRPHHDAGFSFALAGRTAPGLAISTLSSRGHLDYTTALSYREQEALVLTHTGGGALTVHRHGREADHAHTSCAGWLMMPLEERFRATTENMSGVSVILDLDAVTRYAAATCGIGPDALRFHSLTPRSAATAAMLTSAMTHARDDVLADPELAANPLIMANTTKLVTAAVLTAFPNTAHDALTDPDAPHPHGHVPTARVRAALEFLDAHAGRPITPADAAEHVELPTRLLDDALRRQRGWPASIQLWLARIRGAHRDLYDTDPDSDPAAAIAVIAARWGFTSPRAFAVAYTHTTGGDTPEDTLRR